MDEKTFLSHCHALRPVLIKMTDAQQRLEQVSNLDKMLDDMTSIKDSTAVMTALSCLELKPDEQRQLFGKVGAIVSNRSAWSLQNFTSFWTCVSTEMWSDLRSASAKKQLDTLLQHAFKLGLRQPSEPSVQTLTACFIALSPQQATWSPSMKFEQFKLVKKEFKRLKGPPPLDSIAVLPEPEELCKKFPKTYNSVFGFQKHTFQPYVMPMAEFNSVLTSIPMRITRHDSSAMPVSQSVVGFPQNMGAMMQMMQMFLQSMQQMPTSPNPQLPGFRLLPQRQRTSLELPSTADDVAQEPSPTLPVSENSSTSPSGSKLNATTLALVAAADAASKDIPKREKKGESEKSGSKLVKSIKPTPSQKVKTKKADKKEKSSSSTEKPKDAMKLRPRGCKKCRGRPGCTPSCWKSRTKPL
jgi:hypothetical protein